MPGAGWVAPQRVVGRPGTLTVRRDGEDFRLDPTKDPVFDLPVPDKMNPKDPTQREVLIRASAL